MESKRHASQREPVAHNSPQRRSRAAPPPSHRGRVRAAPPERPRRAMGSIEIISRAEGRTLPVYTQDGRQWIVGTPARSTASACAIRRASACLR
jgi:hypothetical protein